MADSSSRTLRHRRCPLHACSTAQALFDDLARHFQISRNANQVGTILVNLLRTDFAFGLAADSLTILRGNQDALLENMAQTEVRFIPFDCCQSPVPQRFISGQHQRHENNTLVRATLLLTQMRLVRPRCLSQVADGMSEAEAGYTRRLTAAKLQGRSIQEVEKIQNRNVLKEIKKRVQVLRTGLTSVAYGSHQVPIYDMYSPV